MSQLLPVILLAAFVVLFGTVLLLFTKFVSGEKSKPDAVKSESYECGLPPDVSGPSKIPIKFYLTAILFILFDIEIIFMYPWALTFGEFISQGHGIYVFSAMTFFLAVFIFGLYWEVKSKALEWE